MSDGFRWLILGYCANEALRWARDRYGAWRFERMIRSIKPGTASICGRGVEVPALTVPCVLRPGHEGKCDGEDVAWSHVQEAPNE